eukprot:COSAG06_NODE_2138_length_7498_cov_24.950554_6_plen_248_part_00
MDGGNWGGEPPPTYAPSPAPPWQPVVATPATCANCAQAAMLASTQAQLIEMLQQQLGATKAELAANKAELVATQADLSDATRRGGSIYDDDGGLGRGGRAGLGRGGGGAAAEGVPPQPRGGVPQGAVLRVSGAGVNEANGYYAVATAEQAQACYARIGQKQPNLAGFHSVARAKPTFVKLGDAQVTIRWSDQYYSGPGSWALGAHRMTAAYITQGDDQRSASRVQPSADGWEAYEGAQPRPKLEWLA